MQYVVRDDELYHFGVLGMKWGVRRYQNKDGTLTAAGKRREKRERLTNEARKKENRISDDAVKDVNRWVREDMQNAREMADTTSKAARQTKDIVAMKKPKQPARIDLSKMSDKEMRDKINRELLERQYNDIFNKPTVSKGRQVVNTVLDAVGNIAGVASSAINLALLIKKLS